MNGHSLHSDGTRRPRADGLASHIIQCNGDISAALMAMLGTERAGKPLRHLKLHAQHFHDAAQILEQSHHPEWAANVTAYADTMYKNKPRGR